VPGPSCGSGSGPAGRRRSGSPLEVEPVFQLVDDSGPPLRRSGTGVDRGRSARYSIGKVS
jgi:hypothetical protein